MTNRAFVVDGPTLVVEALRSPLPVQAVFLGAKLRGNDLSGVNLTAAILIGADLGRANLSGATILPETDFSFANLRDTNFENVSIGDKWRLVADIVSNPQIGRQLSGRDLGCADLSRAELEEADLTNANMLATELGFRLDIVFDTETGSARPTDVVAALLGWDEPTRVDGLLVTKLWTRFGDTADDHPTHEGESWRSYSLPS